MMRIKIVMIAVALITVQARTIRAAESFVIQNGLFTGSDYLALPDDYKRFYVAGAVDGMFLAPLFGAPDHERQSGGRIDALRRCVGGGMTLRQIAAIVTKHLKDHPERWHFSVHTEVFAALSNVCDFPDL